MTDTETEAEQVDRARRVAARVRLATWFFFGVCFALLPFGLLMTDLRSSPAPFREFLERGELFAISAILGAGAIGESLAGAKDYLVKVKSALGYVFRGFCALTAFALNTALYVRIADLPKLEVGLHADTIVADSWALFGVTLVTSSILVWGASR
ncbi:hypothetical protein [Amycolatopsis eburnea]|uniref:Uncharacterized protein n=1 Tax=Amycolatopsis eburnea TaxID=2267691 RepID=A0A3R9DYR4_9PSEU|nr:hypothetical protein [Amycolatopsis eburnea]RSD16374.1 hypothetical protein EIY87_22275 [Amycolatopsis eburnea]